MKHRLHGAIPVLPALALAFAADSTGRASEAPYPPSPVIAGIRWDNDTVKLADGAGDNWPISWVGDGLLITALGDGPGFGNRKPALTIAFAEVTGDPPNVRAEDFVSDADAPMGGGRKGIKASGLLMVDGTLYMFVRNYRPNGSDDYTNARLAWSSDRGRRWTWADWHFADSYGCPEFVQFGKDYQGARDEFVYIVSQANDDAYQYTPNVVLARVPKEAVRDRARYEFFAGCDPAGAPLWTADIAKQRPIFKDPRGTQRVALTYNRGLKRYLLTTSHRPEGVDATHTAALGVFDAPEPWGPWTTVYYDDHWSGATRTYHHKFPPAWMSEDGQTLWLLFSGHGTGHYTFCLKRATLAGIGKENRGLSRKQGS